MGVRMNTRLFLLLPLAATSCSPQRELPPQPAPRSQQRPMPPPPAPPLPPAPRDWADLPLTPGGWTYAGDGGSTSSATFGSPGSPAFRLYCEGPTRSVFLQRFGVAASRTMAVRTSFGARNLAIDPGAQLATATLTARDPFLDNLMFSRGRFSVEVTGLAMLVIPSWAEPARVVEDCRR